jgi:hypothetical protein
VPEADRVERIAEHAREGLQPDLAIGGDAVLASSARIQCSRLLPSRGP